MSQSGFLSFPSRRIGLSALALTLGLGSLHAADETYELPKYAVYSEQVANQTPVSSFAMPVSGLRFEPRVDVQERNMAESQADVSIRGGIFENTGFKVGALSLYDPQTGHYLAEIPIAPAMLLSPQVLTGADNALGGFNAEVGTIASGWRPIEQRGEAAVAFGDYATNRQGFYQGLVAHGGSARTLAADFELSRSESDGSVPFGDHKFQRAAGRLQLRGAQSQTDLFAGTQQKFFGWPNLYTPFGFNETEDLHTQLYVLNHRAWTSPENFWQVGAYYRHNYDDYEFNRAVPGASNPFQHTTRVSAVSLEGHQQLQDFAVSFSAQAMHDSLESTSLTAGRFNTRDYLKLAAVPEYLTDIPAGKLKLRAGVTFDETNRDGSAFSPLVVAELTRPEGTRFYAEYAESTQVPSYTALNSSATSGLFRGNPDLGRETSRNLEAGAAFKSAGWTVETALFYRWDDKLVDWTFTHGVTARSANAVDIGTLGFEVVATRRSARCDFILGYTYLDKSADYGAATIDASFYALNFARHRFTAAVVARLGAGFELRLDNEYRVQEKNALRTIGGNNAFLSAVGLYYLPSRVRGLEFSLLVDNLWDSDFQQVPAVPAARRQFSVGAAYRW
ncbi:MAG: TonB dependent receptor [Lacunisphaera sp.]|nr:TonB dependent receptor [Lacunisphaera sp.]